MRLARALVIASLALTAPACAGAPTVPAAPAGAGAAATPAASGGGNLWSFLCLTPDQIANVKNCYCNSAIGKLISGFGGPMTVMSGGLVDNCCVKNAIQNDLKKPADSPEGAAARIKQDEADAAARAEAVRYLATVDCERWPEAADTLKNALRKDRNECVRWEAAKALRTGCCCNNEIVEALKQCVLGDAKTDPNPAEHSERVRAAAAEALSHCVIVQPVELAPPAPLQKVEAFPNDASDEAYYKRIVRLPREQVVASARAVLVSLQKPTKDHVTAAIPTGTAAAPASPQVGQGSPQTPAPVASAAPPTVATPHPSSVSGIFANAWSPGSSESSRPAFVTNLTRALTGKQEYRTAGTLQTGPPALGETANRSFMPPALESPGTPLENSPAPRLLPVPVNTPTTTPPPANADPRR
jgi:hypothetical protein